MSISPINPANSIAPLANGGGGNSGTPTPPDPADGSYFEPMASPSIQSALNDEFSGDVIDPMWTLFDPGEVSTYTIENTGLVAAVSTSTGNNLHGQIQPLPAGDFTVETYVGQGIVSKAANIYFFTGLGLFEDDTDESQAYTQCLVTGHNIEPSVMTHIWSDYNSSSNGGFTAFDEALTNIFLRIRRNGTTYYFDYSFDGIGWKQWLTVADLGFVPTFFGVAGCYGDGIGVTQTCLWSFFRYVDEDLGINAGIGGRRIGFYSE